MRRTISTAASTPSGFSVRGAAGGANGGLTDPPTIFVQAPSPRAASNSFSDFNIRGAAANASSYRAPTSQPAFSRPSTFGGTAFTSTKTQAGFGHYSSQGVPAFPGVNANANVNAIITGTQRRTAGTWSWTRDNR